MKKTIALLLFLVLAGATAVSAQSLKGMSLNGQTGLIGIPSGRIGWERTADFGIDLGYHAIFDNDATHIPKGSISLFKLLEFSYAYDTQEDNDESDMIIGGKIQLPTTRTAVAIGGNFQMIKSDGEDENYQQVFLAATYPGDFFNMPAETTFVVGKTFGDGVPDEDIDFGMGFDLLLFPDVFQGYIHWINDFANFSYSVDPYAANARYRGAFNTGIRIDLAANPSFSKYKFVIDAMMTDALDDERAFGLGLAFGAPIR
ncbi:MAG: hypothetical protein ACOCYQ_06425 [Alkalispirochaeta sp.]